MDKIIVLNNKNKFPFTFEIRDYEIPKQSKTETFYYKYCKYALGISKYSNNVTEKIPYSHQISRTRHTLLVETRNGNRKPTT